MFSNIYLGVIYNNKIINQLLKIKLLAVKKSSVTSEKLCSGLPEEFTSFIKYCRNLEFEQDPNYDYLKSLFTKVLTRNYPKQELYFFWEINTYINKRNSSVSNGEINSHHKSKKGQAKIIFYNKIKKSLENNKKKEIKNPNNNKLIFEHRDTIIINDVFGKSNTNKSNNKNITEVCGKNCNDVIKTNIKNNSIKVNSKDKILNKKKLNLKKNIYNGYFNSLDNEKSVQSSVTTINKNNNFNIILSNGIDFRKFSFANRSNLANSEKKIYYTSNNSLINSLKYKRFMNSPKKKENKKNIVSPNENNHIRNRIYRTLKERQNIKIKDMNKLIIRKKVNAPKNISFNKYLFQIKKKSQRELYKANNKAYNSNDKIIYIRNITNNKISLTNQHSEYMSFRNNPKNQAYSYMNTIDKNISNLI